MKQDKPKHKSNKQTTFGNNKKNIPWKVENLWDFQELGFFM